MDSSKPGPIAHQIPGAGPTFLPLHFFVLLAGLIIGWRGGVLVGLFGTLISYLLSGMPVLHLLPQITLEIVVYGLAVGILRKNLRFKVVWSLFGAMILGRLARLAFTGLLLLGGVEISPLSYMWFVVVQGLPGIAIQLVVIPVVMHFVENWYGKKAVGRDLI